LYLFSLLMGVATVSATPAPFRVNLERIQGSNPSIHRGGEGKKPHDSILKMTSPELNLGDIPVIDTN